MPAAFESFGGESLVICPSHTRSGAPPFLDDAADLIGSNDGTLYGGVTVEWNRGKGGTRCFVLTTGYIDLDTEVDYSGDFSITLAKKGNVNGTLWGSALGAEALEQLDSTTIRAAFGTIADFTVPANDADWHRITLTRTSGTLRLYYDGEESSTGGVANTDTVHLGRIGGDNAGGDFVGRIDDLRAFSRGLDAAEAKELNTRNYQRRIAKKLRDPVFAISPTRNKHYSSTFIPDLSGNGNGGTINGVTIENQSGASGRKALSFGTTGHYVDCGPVRSSTQLTLMAWVNRNGNNTILSRYFFTGNNRCYRLSTSAGKLRFEASNDGLLASLETIEEDTGSVAFQDWSHVAAVFDNGSVSLYCDGVLTKTGTFTFSTIHDPSDTPFYIGSEEGASSSFDGLVDDPRVYDRALSADEIKLYAGSRDAEYVEDDDDLVCWLHPTQSPGDVDTQEILDRSLNGHNGTLGGALTWNTTDKRSNGVAAVDFKEATGEYTSLANSAALSPHTYDDRFSWGGWFRTDNLGKDQWFFANYGNTGGANRNLISLGLNNSNQVVAQARDSSNRMMIATSTGTVGAGDINHIFAVLNKTTLKIYLNGVEDGSAVYASFDGCNVSDGAPPTFGRYPVTPDIDSLRIAAGTWDDFRIYSRALFPQEIKDRYELTRWGLPESYNKLMGMGQHNEHPALEGYVLGNKANIADIEDRSSYNRTLVQNGSLTAGTGLSSPFANSIEFNASSELRIGQPTEWEGSYTVLLRARADTLRQEILFGYRDSTTELFQLLLEADGTKRLQVRMSGNTIVVASTTAETQTDAVHYAGVLDRENNKVQLFLNGTERDSVSHDFGTEQLRSGWAQIGATRSTTNILQFDGRIEDIAIFNEALPAVLIENASSLAEMIYNPGGSELGFSSTPTEGQALSVTGGNWNIDRDAFPSGSNGLSLGVFKYYTADDEFGTNEQLVDYLENPTQYTLDAGTAGKHVRIEVNSPPSILATPGMDELEWWSSEWTLIETASTGVPSGSADVQAIGEISASGLAHYSGSADVEGLGEINVVGLARNRGSVDVAGIGNIEAIGGGTASGSTDVAAVGEIEAIGKAVHYGSADAQAIGEITASGRAAFAGSADVQGIGNINAVGFAPVVGDATGQAHVVGIGNINAVGKTDRSGVVSVDAIANINAVGKSIRSGTAQVDAEGLINAVGFAPAVDGASGSAQVIGVGLISASGYVRRSGGADCSAVGDINAVGKRIASGSADVQGIGEILAIGFSQGGSPANRYYYENLLTLTT